MKVAETIADACFLLKASPNEILGMPARRFFALFNAAKEIEMKRQAKLLYEMTYVATCAKADQDWITKLASHYRDRFVEKIPHSDNIDAGAKLTAIFGGLGG